MSAATSAATGSPYGLTRVCEAWRVPRSSFSAERALRRALPSSMEVPVRRAPARGSAGHMALGRGSPTSKCWS